MGSLSVKRVRKMGKGVFADKSFKEGVVIHEAHLIKISATDYEDYITYTKLSYYVYASPVHGSKDVFLALGVGSLFNHSEEPNVDYVLNAKTGVITFTALESVKKGSQLFIGYGWDENFICKLA